MRPRCIFSSMVVECYYDGWYGCHLRHVLRLVTRPTLETKRPYMCRPAVARAIYYPTNVRAQMMIHDRTAHGHGRRGKTKKNGNN